MDEDVGVVGVVGAVEGELGFEVEERHGCGGEMPGVMRCGGVSAGRARGK